LSQANFSLFHSSTFTRSKLRRADKINVGQIFKQRDKSGVLDKRETPCADAQNKL